MIYRKGSTRPSAAVRGTSVSPATRSRTSSTSDRRRPARGEGIYAGVAGDLYALRILGRDVDWPLGPGDGPGYADGELGIALVDAATSSAFAPPRRVHRRRVDRAPLRRRRRARRGAAARPGRHRARPRSAGSGRRGRSTRSCARASGRRSPERQASDSPSASRTASPATSSRCFKAAPLQSREHQTGADAPRRSRRCIARRSRSASSSTGRRRSATSRRSSRVQWCHGAPGIVCALAGAPAHRELDAILIAAGELTWEAGPLRKGAGLCHGTAGNGWAFLKLHKRTRDRKWLERARRFAMHAIEQRSGEHGLLSRATSASRSTSARASRSTTAGRCSTSSRARARGSSCPPPGCSGTASVSRKPSDA